MSTTTIGERKHQTKLFVFLSFRAMKSYLPTLMAAIFFLTACRQHQQVKAKIFERRELSKNRLIIKYKYLAGDRIYIDSASVKNTIIGSDSINVIIDPSLPGKSLPDL